MSYSILIMLEKMEDWVANRPKMATHVGDKFEPQADSG